MFKQPVVYIHTIYNVNINYNITIHEHDGIVHNVHPLRFLA